MDESGYNLHLLLAVEEGVWSLPMGRAGLVSHLPTSSTQPADGYSRYPSLAEILTSYCVPYLATSVRSGRSLTHSQTPPQQPRQEDPSQQLPAEHSHADNTRSGDETRLPMSVLSLRGIGAVPSLTLEQLAATYRSDTNGDSSHNGPSSSMERLNGTAGATFSMLVRFVGSQFSQPPPLRREGTSGRGCDITENVPRCM